MHYCSSTHQNEPITMAVHYLGVKSTFLSTLYFKSCTRNTVHPVFFPYPRKKRESRADSPLRPMLMTALKPMGSTTAELAKMAYDFAKGGIDIIKDDHGLANQPYSTFDERVRACAAAVARANAETGRRCIYAPCVCAPAHLVIPRAHAARDAGAGGVLMIPGITGMDTMRELAADPSFGLPIICHPAMLGAMLVRGGTGGEEGEGRGRGIGKAFFSLSSSRSVCFLFFPLFMMTLT